MKQFRITPYRTMVSLALLILAVLSLTACASGSSDSAGVDTADARTMAVVEEAGEYEVEAPESIAYSNTASASESGGVAGETGAVTDTGRKLIRTVDMSVETENYDELMVNVEAKIDELGGYIEFKSAYHGSGGTGNRSADLQVRIPADRLDEFTDNMSEVGNVIRESESVEDVTLTYVDMESHKKMLATEQERLMELLESAETIEDIIALESRLSEVRYQIESMEAQLRTYDNLVDYSTVNLYIEEVARYTPQPEEGAWERIQAGFTENVYLVADGLANFSIELVIALPIIIFWAAVILVAALCIHLFRKWKRKGRALRSERMKDEGTAQGGSGRIPLIKKSLKKKEASVKKDPSEK